MTNARNVARRVRSGNNTITNRELFNALKIWANVSSHSGKYTKGYKKNGKQMTRQNMLNNLKGYINARRIHLKMFPKNNRYPYNIN